MAERYTRLYSLPENLYTPGSPVILAAGALLKDNQTGKILAQLKFKSITEKQINAVKVSIATFDVSGKELEGVAESQYLDLNVRRNQNFGQKQAVFLPDAVTRSMTVKCTEVILESGIIWKAAEDSHWTVLPKQQSIEDSLGKLALQYRRDTSPLSKYAPQEHEDLWQCACGAFNHIDEHECHSCNAIKSALLDALDLDGLQKRKADYDRAVAEEAERKAREAAEKAEKKAAKDKARRTKLRKISIIAAPIVLVATVAILLIKLVIIPNNQYKDAVALMEAGQYTEAIAAFNALSGYKDSAAKSAACSTAILDGIYNEAVALMENGKYDEAIAQFEKIPAHREAKDLIETAKTQKLYTKAAKLMAQSDYEAAATIYKSIQDYEDSADLYKEARYKYAEQLIEKNNFANAIDIFSALDNYHNSLERIEETKELHIQYIYTLLDNGEYFPALLQYARLRDYTVSSLMENDFIVDKAYSFHGHTNLTTASRQISTNWGYYYYNPAVDTSKESVLSTARGIKIGDHKVKVLLAYGTGREGSMSNSSRFYKDMTPSLQSVVSEQCKTYIYYEYEDYKLYFYFDEFDCVSFVAFSYDENLTSSYATASFGASAYWG